MARLGRRASELDLTVWTRTIWTRPVRLPGDLYSGRQASGLDRTVYPQPHHHRVREFGPDLYRAARRLWPRPRNRLGKPGNVAWKPACGEALGLWTWVAVRFWAVGAGRGRAGRLSAERRRSRCVARAAGPSAVMLDGIGRTCTSESTESTRIDRSRPAVDSVKCVKHYIFYKESTESTESTENRRYVSFFFYIYTDHAGLPTGRAVSQGGVCVCKTTFF